MSSGICVVNLRPNRLLLDPSFGGYKLSLDNIPIYRKKIDSGVSVVQPSDEQYSFAHVKIFSLHNHFYFNPHKPNNVYYVDKNLKVFKVNSAPPNQAITIQEVYQIPKSDKKTGRYNVSLVFASAEIVVVSDGNGALYVVNVVEQGDAEVWEDSGSQCKDEVACVLFDARCSDKELHVVLLYVEEKAEMEKEDVKTSLFHTVLKWKVFKSNENHTWEEKCDKVLIVNGSVDYAALEPGCNSIYVISDKLPKWLSDSENAIEVNKVENGEPEKKKLYSWMQTNEEISVWLQLSEDITKGDVEITITNLHMDVKVKGETVISGNFFHRVNKDLTTWTFEKGKLEIQLSKDEEGLMWSSLIPGDERGEEIIDPEVVKKIHEKLSHLCSDKEESGCQPSINSQQLEECDAVSCDTSLLVRLNGDTHSVTHEVSLSSSQWLFKVSCEATQVPAVCCRHDVDACVWQFKKVENDNAWPHDHIGTFSAFGYVQASKTQKKFLASPPNLSYVAVCEASHHIYIYRQPSPLMSELKNRSTGKKVETVSKQQLVNLEAKEPILGVHATNNFLFVLLENSVCVLVINS